MTPARDCCGRLAPSLGYELKRRWKDGATHVVMTLELLIERLLALVPRPRRHLVSYHGVLAHPAVTPVPNPLGVRPVKS